MAAPPQSGSPEHADRLLADDTALRSGVETILRRHGLSGSELRRYDSGSLSAYALGMQQVLKLYPPSDAAHGEVETRVLGAVQGVLPIATPQPLASGVQYGWTYLLMSQLPGQRRSTARAELDAGDRERLGDTLGQSNAALHALELHPFNGQPWPKWRPFMAAQRGSAV
jgi:hygromycin-B 7''-O-kinase